ncbi:MAG: hypothetical protein U0556_02815 [Dehalococcoidia bacterium]
MLQIAANARLATRLAAAGMPPILDDGWPDTERPVLIHTPRGLVAFAVSTAGPACVTGLRYAETVIPLIALPPVVLDVEPSQTVDIALLALLSVLAPVVSAAYLGTLEALAAVERASVRRFGNTRSRARPTLLTWEDAAGAIAGKPLRADRVARRQLTYVRRRFWARLGAGVRAGRRRRTIALRPPTVWPREFR